MANYPETPQDKLEAYPLRLNVSALPERRFFKMTRTLTVCVVLLSALLISLGVYLNYQITHLDVTVRRGGVWQFYRIDPQDKKLKPTESTSIVINPMRLIVEEKLMQYLKVRNSTVWAIDTMNYNFGQTGPIAQLSAPSVFTAFVREGQALLSKTRGNGLVREAHIYDLRLVAPDLWMAVLETFDLPITDDLVSACACSDNSKACLKCKIDESKNRERKKIWIRTSFSRPKTLANPFGVSVDKYVSTFLPIHSEATYWDLPADLQPEI
ncbi:MAG: hypothetical protein II938_01425 [Alphaproteobacteria bacterium]|nr:hypothetical protein [Alphaproteobacteria bacterium]